jgi:hypothetical protein
VASAEPAEDHAAALLHAFGSWASRRGEARLTCCQLALQLPARGGGQAGEQGRDAAGGGGGLALCADTSLPRHALSFGADSFAKAMERVGHLYGSVAAAVQPLPEDADVAPQQNAVSQAEQEAQDAARHAALLAEHAAVHREAAEMAAQQAREWRQILELMQVVARDAQDFLSQITAAAAAAKEASAAAAGEGGTPPGGTQGAANEAAVLEAAAEQARAAATEAEDRAWKAAQRAGQQQANAEKAAADAQQAADAAADAQAAADVLLAVARQLAADAAVQPAEQPFAASEARRAALPPPASHPLAGPRWEVCLHRQAPSPPASLSSREHVRAPAARPPLSTEPE